MTGYLKIRLITNKKAIICVEMYLNADFFVNLHRNWGLKPLRRYRYRKE